MDDEKLAAIYEYLTNLPGFLVSGQNKRADGSSLIGEVSVAEKFGVEGQ